MAKEEVDENESGEDEEEEEEEPTKPKRRKRGFQARPRGRPLKRGGPLGDPRLYHKDVPVGTDGIALEDVPMDYEQIDRIGGFDEESVRITENMKRYIAGKASGMADIRFNGPSREKYFAIRKVHYGAIVAIKQVHPVLNEALAPTNMSACPTYDALLQFVRDRYWKGEDAIYEWQAYTENKASLGKGRFQFAADPYFDREPPQHQQTQQQPQQPANPFGQFGMPGVMMPGVGGMPPMFMPQQAQPQQTHQQNSAAAPAPGDPMAILGPLLNYILPLLQNQAAQSAYLQSLPQVIEQKVKEATPAPAPVVPPPPPPTPVEQMEQAASIISTVNRAGRQMAHALGLQPNPVDEPPPANGEDDFPIQVRRVGAFNVAAQDGKVVDNLLVQAGVNAGPFIGLIDGFFKRLSESKKETAEVELKTIEAKERWERQRLTNLREAKALSGELQSVQNYAPAPEPEIMNAPPWAIERKPPPEPDPKT